MSLPTPVLDDRRFQDIVDEAKRLIPRYCPEWTDHNVSDPGVALIELFAWMTDMLLYRLNQVPDVLYTKFLDLMGIRLFPGAAARTELTFWLSAPQPEPVTVPADTQVGTIRTEYDESVGFLTDAPLTIVQPSLVSCLTGTATGQYEDHWDDLRAPGGRVTCFPTVLPGDAVYFGFAEPLARNTVRLDFAATIEGIGVDPLRPPWAWEVWSGDAWLPARILADDTRGLNVDGALVLLLPPRHEPLTLGPVRACWLRCRMLSPVGDQPPYQSSPTVLSLHATGLGGTVEAHHGQLLPGEVLGRSDGTAGQRYQVRRTPVLSRRSGETVQVTTSAGAEPWTEVDTFTASGPDDKHYTWDGATGEIRFGPQVRYPDGTTRQHGAVPPHGAEISVTRYRRGGGTVGNVGAGTLTVLKSSIPFIARVENLDTATGGVDPETVDNAKRRGPLTILTGQRAVTAGDFERLTLEATPDVARARCLPPAQPDAPARLLVVPRVQVPAEELTLDHLELTDDLVAALSDYLDQRRTLTTRIEIDRPAYRGVTAVAAIRAEPGASPEVVREEALSALYRAIDPLVGGEEGRGWPYGRGLNVGAIFALLAGVDGVANVEEVLLFRADPRTGERGEPRQQVRLPDDSLFVSYNHQVRVL
jgi:predicted phage baseplate assembly protein